MFDGRSPLFSAPLLSRIKQRDSAPSAESKTVSAPSSTSSPWYFFARRLLPPPPPLFKKLPVREGCHGCERFLWASGFLKVTDSLPLPHRFFSSLLSFPRTHTHMHTPTYSIFLHLHLLLSCCVIWILTYLLKEACSTQIPRLAELTAIWLHTLLTLSWKPNDPDNVVLRSTVHMLSYGTVTEWPGNVRYSLLQLLAVAG